MKIYFYAVKVALNGTAPGQLFFNLFRSKAKGARIEVLAPFLFAVYLDDLGKFSFPADGCYIIFYADVILVLSPSVTRLERLLHHCEELTWLDMNINFQKSCCLRVGPGCDVTCAVISSSNGCLLPWVTEMRYLGVFVTNSRTLKCSLDAAKRGFY